jgi:signal transduction histidine kinase
VSRPRRKTPSRLLAAIVSAERAEGTTRTVLIVVALLSIVGIALVNTSTQMDLSLSVLYLVPVAAIAVAVGTRAAYLLAVPAATAWTFDRLLMPHDPRDPWAQLANGFLRYAAMALLIALIGVFRQAVRDARSSDQRSKEFLAYAAHQLRTPIAGVRASSEALVLTTDPTARDQLLSNIAGEARRMGRVVGSLLRITRLDQGDPLEVRPTDLHGELTSEVQRARDLAPELQVGLTLRPDPLPEVLADPSALVEMLANLLDNARRHAAGRIDVDAAHDGEVLVVRISDDGPGLPVGVESLAFDRFVSLDGLGGSGLGLPIARSLAEAHGGRLVYEDKTFVITLAAPLLRRPDRSHRSST